MSFHVPELARITDHPVLGTTSADGNNGAFDLESSQPGWRLSMICSDSSGAEFVCGDAGGARWEHVSVRAYRYDGRQSRVPMWGEMCYVKNLCWDDEDVVMQLHPRKSEYVNNHPHVLHLWRPLDATIPEPPSIYVGIKETAWPAGKNKAHGFGRAATSAGTGSRSTQTAVPNAARCSTVASNRSAGQRNATASDAKQRGTLSHEPVSRPHRRRAQSRGPTRMSTATAPICIHGGLRRKCEACDLADQLERSETRCGELLVACKAALTWHGLDGDHISDPVRAQLLSAIAKAEER